MKYLFLTFLFLLSPEVFAQFESRTGTRLMFYNVENLFDTINDPKTNDDDFTPSGHYRWNAYRLYKKLNNVYKVIAAAGGTEPPEIVAFAEVENKQVIENLIYNTPLSKYRYSVVHEDSRDQRGIDVALVYRPDKIKKITSRYFEAGNYREILYFAFSTYGKDTIHLFVNHWPSRAGGQLSSEKKRMFVADILKAKTDSLFKVNKNAKIIITGDFNDEPSDKSIAGVLSAIKISGQINYEELYNLAYLPDEKYGTIKFRGSWGTFDQFIVSGNLLKKNSTYTQPELFRIFKEGFLLTSDEKYLGVKPFRTFYGFKYESGYSDHLPVLLDLK